MAASDVFADVQAQWARLLVASLADSGIQDAVISPGSRSTPFVVAAAREARLRCHDVADERSAAFFALGRARVTGRPCVLLCTSGSAGTHYLPAVVEAAADHLPLLVVTADRPTELHDAGANQTLDQQKLYGDHVRAFHDLGLADASPRALRALRRRAAQAVFQTRWPVPGAVHLNARARKPLEPAPGSAAKSDLARAVDALLERPIVRPSSPAVAPAPADVEELARAAASTERGLVVAGPASGGGYVTSGASDGPRGAVHELATRLGWPVVADSASGLRGDDTTHATIHAADALLRQDAFVADHRPELVLQVGRAPTATSWLRRIAEWTSEGTEHWVVSRHGWHDPESTAARLVFADPQATLDALAGAMSSDLDRSGSAWHRSWRDASERARDIARDISEDDADRLHEVAAVRTAVESLPPGGRLVVGNSLPARTVDLFAPPPPGPVLHQRGLSGIDGLVAGAVGAALDGEPTLLLLGDVSLRHDAGSLVLARRASRLVILVIDNGGGRIFEELPASEHPATSGVFSHWIQGGSPGWASLARAHGLRHLRPKDRDELEAGITRAFDRGGAWLIEARVPPHSAREAGEELRRRLAEDWDGERAEQKLEDGKETSP